MKFRNFVKNITALSSHLECPKYYIILSDYYSHKTSSFKTLAHLESQNFFL